MVSDKRSTNETIAIVIAAITIGVPVLILIWLVGVGIVDT